MSKALLVQVAEAVVAEITAAVTAGLLPAMTPELDFVPSLEPKDLIGIKIIVCPRSRRSAIVTRAASSKEYEIDIAVLKKITNAELPDMLQLCEQLETFFEGRKIAPAEMPSVSCTEVNNDPVYVPEHIRTRRQFTGILTLTFKGNISHA